MAYDRNIPNTNNIIEQDLMQMQENFSRLGDLLIEQTTFPTNPDDGQLVFVNGQLYKWDSVNNQWVEFKPNNSSNADFSINSDMVDNFHASQTPSPNTIPVSDTNGFINSWINQGAGSGLDADTVDGYNTSLTSAPNVIPITDSTGKLDSSFIPPINAIEKIADITVSTNVAQVDITGLNINNGESYLLYSSIFDDYPLYLHINGINVFNTGSYYFYGSSVNTLSAPLISAGNTTIEYRRTSFTYLYFSDILFIVSFSYVYLLGSSIIYCWISNALTYPVSSLNILTSDGRANIIAGSRFILYKL